MRIDIIQRAIELATAVHGFADRARRFFYMVVLWERQCPQCRGKLEMVAEGTSKCRACDKRIDPTVAFQQCGHCGGQLRLCIRRYECDECGRDVPSRFIFDGLIFDPEYFRDKMAQSRQRQNQKREELRQLLAESRSMPANLPGIDLRMIPGLKEAIDALSHNQSATGDYGGLKDNELRFDLQRYQDHLKAHIGPFPIDFEFLPTLIDDVRLDRIWRFVALLFMDQARIVNLWQEDNDIMVIKYDLNNERHSVSGEAEAAG